MYFFEFYLKYFNLNFIGFPQIKRETIEGYNISIISSKRQNH